MIDKSKLLSKYADNLAKSKNRNHYLSYAKDFLEHTKGLDRASIEQYIADLRKRRYKPGTVNFAFRVIRRLFKVNNLKWEFRQGEAPTIGQRDEYRPQLSPRVIEMMIQAARDGKLYTDEACFLALSTVYGLRREEIANLTPADVDLRNGSIYIATLKRGRERYHLIPNEIKPYLAAHDFSKHYAVATVSDRFNNILEKCGARELTKMRLGWHSIRRPVLEGLVNNGVNVLAARAFLRWKSATPDLAMPSRYFGNVTVDLGQSAPVLEEAKGDKEIFEKHPYLPLWR